MPGSDRRVLVTGSRTWRDLRMVMRVLDAALAEHLTSLGPADITGVNWTFTVVHGGALGADTAAAFWVRKRGELWGRFHVLEEVHRPDYETYGRGRAPFVRNTEMAASGIDECCSFEMPCEKPGCEGRKPHPTHGTGHCAAEAERNGITPRRYTPQTVI